MSEEKHGKTVAAIADMFKEFFRRDLAYVFSGLLSFWIIDYFGQINKIDYLRIARGEVKILETVFFGVAAYFIGYILSEWGDRLGIVDKRLATTKEDRAIKERTEDHMRDYLRIKPDKKKTLGLLERSLGFVHIGAAIGPAIFFFYFYLFSSPQRNVGL